MKELAKVGREYLAQLDEELKEIISEANRKRRELLEEKSTETSPKKENDGDPK